MRATATWGRKVGGMASFYGEIGGMASFYEGGRGHGPLLRGRSGAWSPPARGVGAGHARDPAARFRQPQALAASPGSAAPAWRQ